MDQVSAYSDAMPSGKGGKFDASFEVKGTRDHERARRVMNN